MSTEQRTNTVNQEKRQNGFSGRRNQQNRKFTKQRKFVPRDKQNYRNGQRNESRTIYIGRIFNKDLEGFVLLKSSYFT